MLYHRLNHLPCVAEAQIEEKGEKNERTKDEEASAMRIFVFPRCLLSRHEFGSSNVTSMYFFCKCHTFVICSGPPCILSTLL